MVVFKSYIKPVVAFITIGLFWVLMLGSLISGCSGNCPESTAQAIPASIQSYEVPMADTTTIPDMLYLRPGQSAELLEDIVGTARIPAQGDELYAGPVVLEKGIVVIKPIAE